MMESCLEVSDPQVSDTQLFSNLPIDRLQSWELLPELLRKIAIEDLIEEVAYLESIDLNYTLVEFDDLLTEIKQLSAFEGMNLGQLSAITERELKSQKFKQGKWGTEIESYFTEHQSGLDSVTISILQITDAALAQELFFRIESGEESFAEIAIDYSEGKYAETGGTLGPLFLRELAPPIANIITQLKIGQLSSLFQVDGCYTLFRLDQLSPARLDSRMERFILDELFTNWANEHVAAAEKTAPIVTDRIVYYLSRSELLISYLQQLIVEETLAAWETSSEYVAPTADLTPQERKADLFQQYKRKQWGHLLKSHFLQYKHQIDRVLFSIVQVPDLSLAQELYAQIGEQKHSIHKLAVAHSQHDTAKNGGIVGPIGLAQLSLLIQHHLTGVTAKQLSKLFKLDDDYVFLRVERWLPAQYNEQHEQMLLDRLFAQWLQQQLRQRLDDTHAISFTPVIELVDSHNANNNYSPIPVELDPDPEPDPEPTASLSPTSSFFFPKVSPSGNVIQSTTRAHDDLEPAPTSSFFFPQVVENPISTQFVSEHPHRRSRIFVERIIAFSVFFCLFLVAEIGLMHWLDSKKVELTNQSEPDSRSTVR